MEEPMPNPYEGLPDTAYWRAAVAQVDPLRIGPVWQPRFEVRPEDKVVTFGSCFAQHIGRALIERKFAWLNTELPPADLRPDNVRRFNYDVFSSRTGNIYTPTLLRQWTRWALGDAPPPDEAWQQDGRWFDPFRPAIEPGGFASADEMLRSRRKAIKAFGEAIAQADLFIFTLGLTESWHNSRTGSEYPMCPGTVAGEFDPGEHVFENLGFQRLRDGLGETFDLMKARNPSLRFLLTVSPVPLTATKSGRHVLVATMASKSRLRAVADDIVANRADCDYFPSYELIVSPPFKGRFFEANQRSVTAEGVAFVMDTFFNSLAVHPAHPDIPDEPVQEPARSDEDVVCEDILLDAFVSRRGAGAD